MNLFRSPVQCGIVEGLFIQHDQEWREPKLLKMYESLKGHFGVGTGVCSKQIPEHKINFPLWSFIQNVFYESNEFFLVENSFVTIVVFNEVFS